MMMPRLKIVSQVVAATLGGLLAGPALAATFTVNTMADTVDAFIGDGICADATGACSLRAAIQETNALAGTDTIVLPAGTYTITRPGGEEDAAVTGDLDVTDTAGLVIQGAGATTTIVDGGQLDRVFHVVNGGTLDMGRVTVRNGMAGNQGGGIAVTGASGTGIPSHLRLSEVTITRNRASQGGGLAVTFGGGVAELDKVAVDDNYATGDGGGIYTIGVLSALNSTVAENAATGSGGGVFNSGDLNLTNVTIGQNTADHDLSNQGLGGGLANIETGRAAVINTIVAMNNQGTLAENCHNVGTITSDHSLESGSECAFTDMGDKQNADPRFGTFGMQGGQTPVLPILTGSAAIDSADENLCPSVDQRGFTRTSCDIGAYEAPLWTDLSVTLTAAPNVIDKQQQTVFTVYVQSSGPGVPNATVATLNLPYQLGFISGNAPGGCGANPTGTVVTCQMGVIPSGGSATAQVVAVGLGDGAGNATVTVSGDPTPDPAPNNNSDTTTVTVRSSGGGGAVDLLMLLAGLPLLALRRRRS